MKIKLYLPLVLICLVQLFSCKKDTPQVQPTQQIKSLENGILSVSANGELVAAVIDTINNNITVTVLSNSDESNVTLNFTLAGQVTATISNEIINSGTVLNLSSPAKLTVTSADHKRSTSFTLMAQTEFGYFGLGGSIVEQNSLNRDYEYYFDQFDGSPYQTTNCGPASTTMAIKWADSTFTKTPVDARNAILPDGGWWYTGNVSSYLSENGISNTTDTLGNIDSLIKTNIDNHNAIILCLDMFYVPYDDIDYQHINKFYVTNAPGWGHFILIKGYLQVGNDFYLDAYDPYSEGTRYSSVSVGQLRGKDRYYLDYDIQNATQVWWPYAIILSQKGKALAATTKLQVNSLRKSKTIPQAYGR